MRLSVVCLVLLLTLLASSATAAESQTDINRCLRLTTGSVLKPTPILKDLGLTVIQLKELQRRIISSSKGIVDLEGLDLATEQKTEIQRRIDVQVAAMNRYPLGYPCKPFKNPAKVIAFVKNELLENGFRPRMTFFKTSLRQFQFRGVQDGVSMYGVVVKSAPRQITILLASVTPRWSQTYRFSLAFEA